MGLKDDSEKFTATRVNMGSHSSTGRKGTSAPFSLGRRPAGSRNIRATSTTARATAAAPKSGA